MNLETPYCPRCKSHLRVNLQTNNLQCKCESMFVGRIFFSASGVVIKVYPNIVNMFFPSLNIKIILDKVSKNDYKVIRMETIKGFKVYNIENYFDETNSINEIITYIFKFKNNEIFQ